MKMQDDLFIQYASSTRLGLCNVFQKTKNIIFSERKNQSGMLVTSAPSLLNLPACLKFSIVLTNSNTLKFEPLQYQFKFGFLREKFS